MTINDAIKDEMLEYAKKKYGEIFQADTLIKSNWAYAYDTLYVYPDGKPDDKFEIHRYIDETNMGSYADGYFGKLIKNDYESVVADLVKESVGEAEVIISFDQVIFAQRLNGDIKVSEIYRFEENFSSQIDIFVTSDQLGGTQFIEAQLKDLGAKMADKKLVSHLDLYVISDEEYRFLDEETFKNGLKNLKIFDRRTIQVDYSLNIFIRKVGDF